MKWKFTYGTSAALNWKKFIALDRESQILATVAERTFMYSLIFTCFSSFMATMASKVWHATGPQDTSNTAWRQLQNQLASATSAKWMPSIYLSYCRTSKLEASNAVPRAKDESENLARRRFRRRRAQTVKIEGQQEGLKRKCGVNPKFTWLPRSRLGVMCVVTERILRKFRCRRHYLLSSSEQEMQECVSYIWIVAKATPLCN